MQHRYWSDDHCRYLYRLANRIAGCLGGRWGITADELVSIAWMRAAHRRPPNRLKGTGTHLKQIMWSAVGELAWGVKPWQWHMDRPRARAFTECESPYCSYESEGGPNAGLFGPSLVDPHDYFAEVDARDTVQVAMSRLSDRSRDIVTRRYFHEQSTAQIAKQLGVSRQRIDQLLQAAHRSLLTILEKINGADHCT